MRRLGFDSTAEIPAALHRAHGSTFALRYLSRYTAKVVTRREADDYRRNGIGLAVVFEDFADNALKGYAQGHADAVFALGQARGCGMPAGRPIYFAVDLDVQNPAAVVPYFKGAAAVIGWPNVGVYGGVRVVSYLLDRGVRWAWQTYAWSAGRLDHRAQLYQFANGHALGRGYEVDYDYALTADFGQWWGLPAVENRPHGIANALVRYDLATGQWHVHGAPGHVRWAQGQKVAKAELELVAGGKGHGRWQVKGHR